MAQSSSTPEHEQGNKENHTPSRCCACCFPCHGESLLRCDPHSCCRLTCISALEAELSCAICLDICVRPCTTPCGEPCLGLVKSASVCSMLGPQAPAPAPAQDLLHGLWLLCRPFFLPAMPDRGTQASAAVSKMPHAAASRCVSLCAAPFAAACRHRCCH